MLTQFEEVLAQYEPMISACIRKLNIYRDHESFRQAGRVALWQAWTRFEEEKGHFTPYAFRSIRGAMLDELKKESRFTENVMQTEGEILSLIMSKLEDPVPLEWSERFAHAFESLSANERQLIQLLFIEALTQAECATILGISIAGVKKRRERLLSKLKTSIK